VNKKLIKKLKREASANPKKAAILGVLLLVAVYFWIPLVSRWISHPKDQAQSALPPAPATGGQASAPAPALPNVAAVATLPGMPVSGTAAPGGAGTKPAPTWQELAEAIDRDPLMRPASPGITGPARQNPFGRLQPVELVKDTDELKSSESLADDAQPAELGLVLSSTVVGAARQTAVINGKVYTLGREVPAGDGASFLLTEIQPRRIVLKRAGREFELKIARPTDLK